MVLQGWNNYNEKGDEENRPVNNKTNFIAEPLVF